MKRKALIDLDLLLYRSGFASQSTLLYVYEVGNEEFGWMAALKNKTEFKKWKEFHPGEYVVEEVTEAEPIQNYIAIMKATVKSILFMTGSDSYIGYLTGPNNYRHEVATLQKYKGNRDNARKPERYEEAKQYLIDHMDAVVCEDYEADDGMSMEQWGEWDKRMYTERENTPTVICTADKDLDMVPGFHYNWIKKELYFVEEDEGMRFFFKQVLTGDSTDNIPGLFRCTGQRALKRIVAKLDDHHTWNDMNAYVRSVYTMYFMNDYTDRADMIKLDSIVDEIMRLLWMSRSKIDDCPV